MDDTMASVDITFWGACAKVPGLQIGRVIAVKDCRVSDYKGVSLNGPFDSSDIKLEESIGHPRLQELKKWAKGSNEANVTSITEKSIEGK